MSLKLWIAVVFTVGVVGAGVALYSLNFHRFGDPKIISKVGIFTITDKDIAYRDQIIKLMYPEEAKSFGLVQLKQAYTSAQILINNGHTITPEMIEQEAARIQRDSKMPDLLAKIQAVFGGNKHAYHLVYVLPVYAERTIYFGFFLHHLPAHQTSLSRVQKALDEAIKQKRPFGLIAKPKDVFHSHMIVSTKDGIQSEAWSDYIKKDKSKRGIISEQSTKPNDPSIPQAVIERQKEQQKQIEVENAKNWFENIIRNLKPGEIHPKVVDNGEMWAIARFMSRLEGDRFELEVLEFPKDDYQQWYETEKAKIEVTDY